ncbi:MAG TPA: choice-of-anchor D domain-containing protein [Acidimicrobiales bacterium]|nr:choice-of-anchor D domain-containing protein [Acidimicrobiales bacterium]
MTRKLKVALFAAIVAILGVSGSTISVLTSTARSPRSTLDSEEPENEAHEKKEQRRLNARAHADQHGKVNSSEWRKAAKEWGGIAIDASAPSGAAGATGADAPVGAGGNGVVGAQWTQVGPAPKVIDAEQNYQGTGPDAGQVVDIAIDPRNTSDQVIYAAFNDGGIWKTTDGGANWRPKTDYMPSLSMGSVVLDPGNPSIVYAGTGNIYNNGFFKGIGIYRSIDGGDTWSIPAGSADLNGCGIHDMVMPAANRLLVATNTCGLMLSINGGTSFGNNSPAFDDGDPVLGGSITDLDLDTTAANTVYAGRSGQGIFQSTDGGATWPTNLTPAGEPNIPASYGYVSFTQSSAPDNQTMYANFDVPDPDPDGSGPTPAPPNSAQAVRSTNSGADWTTIGTAGSTVAAGGGCQCGYDQTAGVDPADATRIFFGYQQLFRSTNSGGAFSNVTDGLVHWDHHEIIWSPSSHWVPGDTTPRMYVGTDGGISYSDDGGTSWSHINGKIATNLFRAMDMGRGATDGTGIGGPNNGWMYGGFQDTGTAHRNPTHAGTEWHEAVDADGGPVAVDWQDPRNAYGQSNGGYIRTGDGGASWNRPGSASLSGDCDGDGNGDRGVTGAPAVDPNNGYNVFVSMSGTQCGGVFRSSDATATGPRGDDFAATPIYANGATNADGGSTVVAMNLVPIDSATMWVGKADGDVAFSNNVLAADPDWTHRTVTGKPGGQPVAGIAVDPTNTDIAVVVYQGQPTGLATTSPTRHVFRTTDRGVTWADISGTEANNRVPNLPLYSVVIDPGTNPHSIIVSTDLGVLRSSDDGVTWQKLGLGLPNVNVTSLQIDYTVQPSLLRLGTYGRSAFELTAAKGPLLAVNGDLSFGTVSVGSSLTRPVQLFNVGSETLNINSFFRSSGSAEFQVISGPSTPVAVEPGNFIEYTVRFAPVDEGDEIASFQVNSNDQFEPVKQIPASGTGAVGNIVVSGDLRFGTVARGTQAIREVTVFNTGGGVLNLSSVAFVGGSDSAFSVVNPQAPQAVQPGEHLMFTIKFAPPANSGPAERTGTLRIQSDDPNSPPTCTTTCGRVDVPASGTPGVPAATVGSSSIGFGSVAVDNRTTPSFVDKTLVIANQASCPLCDLSVESLLITGADSVDFTLVSPPALPTKVAAGTQLELTVRFNSAVEGPRSATLTVNTDDPVTPSFPVSLTGSGLKPAIGAAPSPLIFGPTVYSPMCGVSCGVTSPVVITNTGQAELILDVLSLGASPAFSAPAATTPPTRKQIGTTLSEPVKFAPSGGSARRLESNLHIQDSFPLDPGNVVARDVLLCGESVGRGFRVLVRDRQGNVVTKVDSIKLASVGVTPNASFNVKNSLLTTIDEPVSCQQIRFHYENQNLQATDQSAPRGSYYTLTASVGNKHSTVTFTLAPNQFRTIDMTVG